MIVLMGGSNLTAQDVPGSGGLDFDEKYRVLIDRNPFMPQAKKMETVIQKSERSMSFNFTGYWKWKDVIRVSITNARANPSQPSNFVISPGETIELTPGNTVTLNEVNVEGRTPYVVLNQGGEVFRVEMADQKYGMSGMAMPGMQQPMMPQMPTPDMPQMEMPQDNSANINPPGPQIIDPPTTPQRTTRRRIVLPQRPTPGAEQPPQ